MKSVVEMVALAEVFTVAALAEVEDVPVLDVLVLAAGVTLLNRDLLMAEIFMDELGERLETQTGRSKGTGVGRGGRSRGSRGGRAGRAPGRKARQRELGGSLRLLA